MLFILKIYIFAYPSFQYSIIYCLSHVIIFEKQITSNQFHQIKFVIKYSVIMTIKYINCFQDSGVLHKGLTNAWWKEPCLTNGSVRNKEKVSSLVDRDGSLTLENS